jgi:hypothetical protein
MSAEPSPTPPVTVTLVMPAEIAARLLALADPTYGPETIEGVLGKLADHAQQAVYRSGAWEREWACQAFGYDWPANLEPDPDEDVPSWDRPRNRPPAAVLGDGLLEAIRDALNVPWPASDSDADRRQRATIRAHRVSAVIEAITGVLGQPPVAPRAAAAVIRAAIAQTPVRYPPLGGEGAGATDA